MVCVIVCDTDTGIYIDISSDESWSSVDALPLLVLCLSLALHSHSGGAPSPRHLFSNRVMLDAYHANLVTSSFETQIYTGI
jgi:hypothetical protein